MSTVKSVTTMLLREGFTNETEGKHVKSLIPAGICRPLTIVTRARNSANRYHPVFTGLWRSVVASG